MVNVISDQRTWEVVHTFKNDECPHLYYPANYHGCRLLPIDKDYCTLENCRHLSEAPTRPDIAKANQKKVIKEAAQDSYKKWLKSDG